MKISLVGARLIHWIIHREVEEMNTRLKNYIVSTFLILFIIVLFWGVRLWIVSIASWDEVMAIDLRFMTIGMLIAVIVIVTSVIAKKQIVSFASAVVSLCLSLFCNPVLFSALYLIGVISALASIPFVVSLVDKVTNAK